VASGGGDGLRSLMENFWNQGFRLGAVAVMALALVGAQPARSADESGAREPKILGLRESVGTKRRGEIGEQCAAMV